MASTVQGPADGGRFVDLSGRAVVDQAVEEAGRAERIIAAALVVGAAWVVARSPRLRRFVWRHARQAVSVWLPVYLAREVSTAWRTSARPRPAGAGR